MRPWLGIALLTVACGEGPSLGAGLGSTPGHSSASEGSGSGSSADTWADEGGEAGDGAGDSGAANTDIPGDADPQLPFYESAVELGVDLVHNANAHHFSMPGQAWADIDRDGFLDLVLTTQLANNRVFMGGPGGQFTTPSWAEDIALPDQISAGAVFADYDNDGWPDLYITAMGPNTLLRNLEGEGFVDVSEAAGVGDPGVGETAAFGDLDGDGHLDLYVTNNDIASPDPVYHNRGDGSFEDVSHLLELDTRSRPSFSASFFDYDLDGDVDLYVANDKQVGNVLWRNDGPGCGGWCLTDVSASSGAGVELYSMGLAVGDYDSDGDQDLFVTSIGDMALLQNQTAQGQPEFLEIAAEAGTQVDTLGWGEVGWGAQFLDYDNDGWLDLYVALGKQDPGPQQHNMLLRNLANGSFAVVDEVGGAADPRMSFGLAIADHDADGWVDLLVGNSGDRYALYRNRSGEFQADRHHLSIELRADSSDAPISPEAIGARVYVHDDRGRTQLREVIAGSSLGAGSSLVLHFGLGHAVPVWVRVIWPDGRVDQWQDPPVDTRWVIDYPT
ncbi:FG-GAP repeat protein [Enhygromyxa salina]|uniref:FG-GAP repeat protein n=1 Tax=Enhygromyxa salina TaxID=215803 RepID=A0A2S9XAY3_9BACT|nr:CRTAC1 family protein [Enhygromyxa salina]PRP90009.1 FG-GAP repeat protein [Enhygromyxa salina]